jgi:hypothetical protein
MGLASLGRRGGDFGDFGDEPTLRKEVKMLLGYIIMRADGLMVHEDLLSSTPNLSDAYVFPTKESAEGFFGGFGPTQGETWNIYEIRVTAVKT